MSLVEMKENMKYIIRRNDTTIVFTKTAHPIKRTKTRNIDSKEKSKNHEKNYKKRMKTRAAAIREIFSNNFRQSDIILHLTFDPLKFLNDDLGNIDFTHREFKKFIQRMKRRYDNFIYLATFSRQDNGNWHYHLVTNLPFNNPVIELDESLQKIEGIWGNGYCEVKALSTMKYYENLKNYMIENMEQFEEDKKGRRGYLCSKNITRPIVLKENKPEDHERYELATKRIMQNGIYPIGTSETVIGITDQPVIDGVVFNMRFGDGLTAELEKQGFKNVTATTIVGMSNAVFFDWFPPIERAVLREKIRK